MLTFFHKSPKKRPCVAGPFGRLQQAAHLFKRSSFLNPTRRIARFSVLVSARKKATFYLPIPVQGQSVPLEDDGKES